MPKESISNKTVIFFLAVSIFGLLTTLILGATGTVMRDNYSWRKPFIGSMFSLICLAGIAAAFRSNKCSEKFEPEETSEALANGMAPDCQTKGHHPDCGKFSTHTIVFSKYVLCAACSGLALGAFLAVLGTAFYVFAGNLPVEMGKLMVFAGSIGVLLGFSQLKFRGYVRLALNAVFVCGAFLTLVGLDVLAENVILDVYVVSLIGLWIWTRIMLSEWDHARICRSCMYKCVLGRS